MSDASNAVGPADGRTEPRPEACDHQCTCGHDQQDHSTGGWCNPCGDMCRNNGHYPSECWVTTVATPATPADLRTRTPLDDLTSDELDQLYDRAERTDTAEHERALDNVALHAIAGQRDAAEAAIERLREVLGFAEKVAATSGPGPASAVRAVIHRLRAAIDPAPTDGEQRP